jgi:hypothetical protein
MVVRFAHLRWFFVAMCVSATLGVCAQGQPANCSSLKEGRFEIHDKKTGISVITRKAGVQREENEQMGVVVEYLMEWIDECSFRLLPFKVIRNDNNLELDGDLKLVVEIVEIRDSVYIQETTAWATGQFETEEVRIIR